MGRRTVGGEKILIHHFNDVTTISTPAPCHLLSLSHNNSKSIISVFSRLDELKANVLYNRQHAGDSSMLGMDELFVWLDAVAARTVHGPVLLVCSHADQVPSARDRQAVSDAIVARLTEQEHPLLSRIVRPQTKDGRDSSLLFFPLDNTKGLDDAGVTLYRDSLQRLCRDAPSATQRVPLSLLHMLDLISALQREAKADDPPAVAAVRAQYQTQGRLHRLQLSDAAQLYSAACERQLGPAFGTDSDFRLYLDFFHMQGLITHSNAAGLDDLVIIDPLWLLQQETAIVRRPQLHPRAGDDFLPATLKRALYDAGILKPGLVGRLWSDHAPAIQLQLLGLMMQVCVL